MSALATATAAHTGDSLLSADVLAHLEVQLGSAQTLLAIVLEQGRAIRAREVHEVVLQAGRLQAELQRRRQIETDRARLLERAAARLRIASGAVTLEALTTLMDPQSAHTARGRSAKLRGMLDEIQREHLVNRALMTQELAFLDHLLRLVDLDGPGAYVNSALGRPERPAEAVGGRRVFDTEA